MERRRALQMIGFSMLAAHGPFAEPQSGKVTVEAWMSAWMNDTERTPKGVLFLSRFVEPIYFLRQPIVWEPTSEQRQYKAVRVPTGFVTDLASIPRVFWSLLRPDGAYTYPAIVHDYLYWQQPCARETADMILRFGMEDFGIGRLTIETIFNAVRLGGAGSWSENQKLKAAGERRILKVFPSDPRTKWAAWKKRRDVFADE